VKYLLIIHNNRALLESLSPAELDAMVGAHEPFQAALRGTGETGGDGGSRAGDVSERAL
jgi:hypothetical protein